MQPIVTDVAWSVCVCLLVDHNSTVGRGEMAEAIEVHLGCRLIWFQNHVLDGCGLKWTQGTMC